MKKIKGLFNLIRFELPFSAGVCVVMGQMLALGNFPSIYLTLAAFFAVFSISASILVSNDYYDVETDKINAPFRPLASNTVTLNEAKILSIFLLTAGLFLSYLISFAALLISIILMIIGFMYNRYYKKSGLQGNIMVSFSVGMTFIYGGVSVGQPFHKAVVFFALIAALIDLGEEIAADVMDMEGDLLINSNSVAIKYGRDTALKTSVFIFLLVVLLSFIPFIMKWFPVIYLIPILIMDFFILYPAVKLLKSGNENGRKYIRTIYLGATLGLVIFLVMRMFSL